MCIHFNFCGCTFKLMWFYLIIRRLNSMLSLNTVCLENSPGSIILRMKAINNDSVEIPRLSYDKVRVENNWAIGHYDLLAKLFQMGREYGLRKA